MIRRLQTVGCIAGSYALHLFQTWHERTPPAWQPHDIDVYVDLKEVGADESYVPRDCSRTAELRLSAQGVEALCEFWGIHDSSYVRENTSAPNGFVMAGTVLKHVGRHRKWRKYDWKGLMPFWTDGADYGIEFTSAGTVTVDLGRDKLLMRDVNLVFVDGCTRRPYGITDAFDLTCCAVRCLVSDGRMTFEVRDRARVHILSKLLRFQRGFRKHTSTKRGYREAAQPFDGTAAADLGSSPTSKVLRLP